MKKLLILILSSVTVLASTILTWWPTENAVVSGYNVTLYDMIRRPVRQMYTTNFYIEERLIMSGIRPGIYQVSVHSITGAVFNTKVVGAPDGSVNLTNQYFFRWEELPSPPTAVKIIE
jgi:hypothetical protein